MTAKQKANRERFKKVVAEAKKLRKKNPKLTQAQAVKQAWAISYSKKRAGVGNVTLKKSNYHKNDERYLVMNDGVAHLDGQPFFKKDAERIAKALRIVKKKRKEKSKVGATKTKVKANKSKRTSEMHTDTKSHNVNIRVISGIDDQMSAIRNNLEKSIDYYMKRIAMIQNAYGRLSASEKLQAKKIIKRYKTTITKLLKQLRETNQLIAKNVK